jgi:glutamate-5-semialdehyde dehydrogenase
MHLGDLLQRARAASQQLRKQPEAHRNRALLAIAEHLEANPTPVLQANLQDLEAATELSPAMQDRLRLDSARVAGLARAAREVAALPDPLQGSRALGPGRSGIQVSRRRVPLGVVAIVFEARPGVVIECAALTIKSGNVVILRGGKEALRSNRVLVELVRDGLRAAGLPEDAVLFVDDPDRAAVIELLSASGQVDLVIPRGGKALMALVDQHARVPVIRHGEGICHVYVDADADLSLATPIALNAKTHRPGVCNAMETLLVHRSVLVPLLQVLGPALIKKGVELRADLEALTTLGVFGCPAQEATAADWATEFLAPILAVRTVGSLDEALAHIERYGTRHTAAIVTKNADAAERFLAEVDASCVLWNASTRFNDGGELGLGAEMGISTSKLHAYGPMGLTELTAEKLVVHGQGQIRQ